jgi:hypothetical protein
MLFVVFVSRARAPPCGRGLAGGLVRRLVRRQKFSSKREHLCVWSCLSEESGHLLVGEGLFRFFSLD